MDLAIALRQRVTWTQRWLKGNDQKCNEANAEDLDFVLIPKDDNESHHDIISLSSQDPATSCADDDEIQSEALSWPSHCPSCGWPYDWCFLCETAHASWQNHDPWYWEDHGDPESISNKSHIAYELAGRNITHTFRDFRSPAKARKRKQARKQKYYNHRFIKPGQLNAPHWSLCIGRDIFHPALPEDAEVVIMNKHMLYHEAQTYPRPPTSHRRGAEKDRWPGPSIIKKRKEKKKAHYQAEADFIDARGLDVYLSELPYDYDWAADNEALSQLYASEAWCSELGIEYNGIEN